MIVINYGGGTNSTALLVEAHRRGIRPDLIVFADTGGEMPHTYEYIQKTMEPWLDRVGFPALLRTRWFRVMAPYKGEFRSLEETSISHGEMPSKAPTATPGAVRSTRSNPSTSS